MSSEMQPIKLIGKAYVKEGDPKNQDCFLVIDSEEIKGIIFGFFAKQDIGNAQLAAEALNLWAGFDDAAEAPKRNRIITN